MLASPQWLPWTRSPCESTGAQYFTIWTYTFTSLTTISATVSPALYFRQRVRVQLCANPKRIDDKIITKHDDRRKPGLSSAANEVCFAKSSRFTWSHRKINTLPIHHLCSKNMWPFTSAWPAHSRAGERRSRRRSLPGSPIEHSVGRPATLEEPFPSPVPRRGEGSRRFPKIPHLCCLPRA